VVFLVASWLQVGSKTSEKAPAENENKPKGKRREKLCLM